MIICYDNTTLHSLSSAAKPTFPRTRIQHAYMLKRSQTTSLPTKLNLQHLKPCESLKSVTTSLIHKEDTIESNRIIKESLYCFLPPVTNTTFNCFKTWPTTCCLRCEPCFRHQLQTARIAVTRKFTEPHEY